MAKKQLTYWIFLAPVLITFAIAQAIPFIMGIVYSFTNWNGVSATVSFNGLSNYAAIFKDKDFFNAFLFTIQYTIVAVILLNLFGFLLAMLGTRETKISRALRTIFFMPNLIGGLILGFIWLFIFMQVFQNIGTMTHQAWLTGWLSDQKTGLAGLIILTIWQMAGYYMLIYISSIQSVPPEVIEAAKIDGANAFQRTWSITLPMIRPAFTICLFLTLSNSFKLYDQNLSLTNGGPSNSTTMLAMNIYKTAFSYNQMGQAQAKAVIFFIVVALIGLTQVYFSSRKEIEA